MTARDTFNASVASAEKSKLNTIAAAETTRQATVDISNSFVGYNLQTGTFSSYQAAVTAANTPRSRHSPQPRLPSNPPWRLHGIRCNRPET
jgi:predicted component of type VI protein secretion system